MPATVQWFVAIWPDYLSGWELLGIYSSREVAQSTGDEWSSLPHGQADRFIFGCVPEAMSSAALLCELRAVRHPASPHHSWTYAEFCNRLEAMCRPGAQAPRRLPSPSVPFNSPASVGVAPHLGASSRRST